MCVGYKAEHTFEEDFKGHIQKMMQQEMKKQKSKKTVSRRNWSFTILLPTILKTTMVITLYGMKLRNK